MERDKKAYFKFIFSLLLFGINGIVASHINLTSSEIVFLRTLLGSIFLIIMFVLTGGKFHVKQYPKDMLFIILSGIAMGTSWMFLYEAFQQIGVSLASLLYYCGPVLVMIVSPFVFKEMLTVPKIVGFLIVLVGIFLVNGINDTNNSNTWGFICGLLSAVTYCLMVTFNKQSRNIVGFENSAIQLIISFLTVAVFIGVRQHFVIVIPVESWPWILVLGIITTGVGCYLYFSSLSKIPAQTAAIFGYFELLSAVIFAAILLHEKMSLSQSIGAVCIIGGAMLGELVKTKKKQHDN